MDAEILFEERQRVSRTPVILLPVSITVIALWALVSRVMAAESASQQTAASLMSLSLAFVFTVFLLALFLKFGLIVRVTRDRLVLFYTPFHERPIHRADIVEATVMHYDPLRNFGWGRKGRSWTVWGTHAVRVVLRNGEEIIIGTRRPEDFLAVLSQKFPQGQPTHEQRQLHR